MSSVVTLPKKVFDNLIMASEYFELAQNEMEDYFLAKNKGFLARARKARNEHKQGKFGDWSKLKSKYGL